MHVASRKSEINDRRIILRINPFGSFSYDQMARLTPKSTPHSSNFHATSTRGCLIYLDRFNMLKVTHTGRIFNPLRRTVPWVCKSSDSVNPFLVGVARHTFGSFVPVRYLNP
ncbi:hypothetical protein AVEN_216026-1 [Araneus ventricosus]|uniref:Uncharacterized protein n=1 Tax=Araneus ventricosus TaxID=182803 RepID=A0A4Y2I7K7_ARAVE|nr:hypothetical protein AVEN_216026-1 [Araneus ventricosus]